VKDHLPSPSAKTINQVAAGPAFKIIERERVLGGGPRGKESQGKTKSFVKRLKAAHFLGTETGAHKEKNPKGKEVGESLLRRFFLPKKK